ANDKEAHARLHRVNPKAPAQPTLRDVQQALAREYGLSSWIALRRQIVVEIHASVVDSFLRMACLGWRVRHPGRPPQTDAARRLLQRHPEIARENIYTAVACDELELVKSILKERPDLAVTAGGPRQWQPLLYLCHARLPGKGANAVAIARVLLDRGADPN